MKIIITKTNIMKTRLLRLSFIITLLLSVSQFSFLAANNALSFDGVDDKVTINPYPSHVGNITFSSWVKFNNTSSFGTVCYWQTSPSWELLFRIYNGGLQIIYNNAAVSGGIISAGVWYHLAFTKSANQFKVYVNGVLKGSGTLGSTEPVATSFTLGYIP